MSNVLKLCEFHGRPDQIKPATFAFKHADGKETYICDLHCDAYAQKNPDAVKTRITT